MNHEDVSTRCRRLRLASRRRFRGIPGRRLADDRIDTTEVTRANVTVSPDGQRLIFTIVGHLFRLPVEGGTAELHK